LLSYSVTDGSGSILAILDAITDIRALYQANETQQNDQSSTLWSEARVSLKEENREQQLPVLPGPEPVLEHHERPAHAETIRNHQQNSRTNRQEPLALCSLGAVEEQLVRSPPDVEGPLAGRAAAAADAGADALGRALQRLGRPGVLDPLRLPVAPCPTQLSSGRPRQRVT